MRHTTKFAFLGFQFNMLIDQGAHLELKDITVALDDLKLFKFLKNKYGKALDLTLFKEKELAEIERYFLGLWETVNEEKKMGVRNNGLCLLVAYCFNALQTEESKMNYS